MERRTMSYNIWIREPGQTIGRTLHAYEVIESGQRIRLRVKFADDAAGLLPLVIEDHDEAVARLRQVERCSVGGGIPEIVEAPSEPGKIGGHTMAIYASTPPVNTDPFPRQSHTYPAPDPAWNVRRAHDGNPILIAMRDALAAGASVRDLLDDLNGYLNAYPGADAMADAFDAIFAATTGDEWKAQRVHARRVLYRWLAVFGEAYEPTSEPG